MCGGAVGIEGPNLTSGNKIEGWFPVSEDELGVGASAGIFVGEFNTGGSVPLHVHNGSRTVWAEAVDLCASC